MKTLLLLVSLLLGGAAAAQERGLQVQTIDIAGGRLIRLVDGNSDVGWTFADPNPGCGRVSLQTDPDEGPTSLTESVGSATITTWRGKGESLRHFVERHRKTAREIRDLLSGV